jgi:S-DNA-T family DNA segregation ATPase FtsK/SpoIIIE
MVSQSDKIAFWRDFLFGNMGWVFLATPLVFLSIGLVLLKLKWSVAQPNLLVGMIAMMIGTMGLLGAVSERAGGVWGRGMWVELSGLVSPMIAGGIFVVGVVIGVVVATNASLTEILGVFSGMFKGVMGMFGMFKKAPSFGTNLNEPKMKMSGMDDEVIRAKLPEKKKEVAEKGVLPETLIATVAGQTRVWKYPPYNLLTDKSGAPADRGDVKKNAASIERALESFGIQARVAEVNGGPAVTQYALELATGTKITKITNLQHDIALALATRTGTVRVEAPIPGKSLVGIEVPNQSLEMVTLKSILTSDEMSKHKSKLAVCLGKDTASHPVIVDIDRMPHSLVAGTTGSGKSVLMNSILCSLLFRNTPDELKLILIDPKRVEMDGYNGIPHLLSPVIVEPKQILSALKWVEQEMDRRYKVFQQVGARNIASYNEMSGFQSLPYIVVMIDELADLMMMAAAEVEASITRLAQLARATGIHLILATQRPSTDVITGLMKANIPCRIAFNVSSMVDSRVILDQPGAEKLLGRGDMLYLPPDASKPMRIQGVLVQDAEITGLVNYIKEMGVGPQYTAEVTEMPVSRSGGGRGSRSMGGDTGDRDDLFEEAAALCAGADTVSATLFQRRLKVGYARAARILDELEQAGIVGPADGSKAREVLVRNVDEALGRSSGISEPETY